MFDRQTQLDRLRDPSQRWDILVIGGGATGIGIAVDAASRGFRTALVEQHDFGKATSSRSTKLIHGGVRYLAQANFSLVREALHERSTLLANAPHVVRDLELVIPCYRWWEKTYYRLGLKFYDWLAGQHPFGKSRGLSRAETARRFPTVQTNHLRGGVLYHDGQFDDARLLVNLMQTAVEQGATMANHVRAAQLLKRDQRICGAVVVDQESGEEFEIAATAVINATGAFTDEVRQLDDSDARQMVAASQGIHLVFKREFLPGDTGLLVPSSDDRVLFALPWHDVVIVGTTDTPLKTASLEPTPLEDEVDFVLENIGQYLSPRPSRADVLSQWAGIRPLVQPDSSTNTATISREHSINDSPSALVTIAGGKWTTYREMAEDCVDHVIQVFGLDEKPCITETLKVHGHCESSQTDERLWFYGADATAIAAMESTAEGTGNAEGRSSSVSQAQVQWAARQEMARTVEDVLSRRTRLLMTDAQAAIDAAPQVAAWLAEELGRDSRWQTEQVDQFTELARGYLARK